VTRASCPDCRLRFTPAATAELLACPACGGPLRTLDRPDMAVGLRLYAPEHAPAPLPEAIAASMSIPDPPTRSTDRRSGPRAAR
jgi:hypothetical protein